ncbi:uncharacterized protein LOC106873273 [Octopus bimaculoides]|uniref:uncharacterized protein LOC106873273 n=1 Tax=Octopus bimaculoides TaxID=37653 RepID=UPI00071D58AA|nr:uncharacterized protein LOC106873273 [Octopus bimaculoides]|eukprot:XP_014776053.1 PREDICTED: uncharacterized protein LOC106873273 [Octopus bimaculoides]
MPLILVADPPASCNRPSVDKVCMVVNQLRGGKAGGVCGIHWEIIKKSGPVVVLFVWQIIYSIWISDVIPLNWKTAVIVPIKKDKGEHHDCNNYRAVTFFLVPSKVFAKVILNVVQNYLFASQQPEQSVFTPKKSTTNKILVFCVLIECKQGCWQELLTAFTDLHKAFDSGDRNVLWRILELQGIPLLQVGLMVALYTGTVSAGLNV